MYAPTRVAGYVVLVVTPAALFASALFAGDVSATVLGLEGGVVLAGGVAAATEHQRALDAPGAPEFRRPDALDALAVPVAAVLTYWLSVHAGLGPVVASAVVGLVAGVRLPQVGVSAYCGSFVGMASPVLFPSVGYVAAAGLLSALGFVAADRAFDGFGGKLGTLALFGCATTVALTGAEFATGSADPRAGVALTVPVAVAAAVATVVLSVRLELGAVVGSAVVGLVTGLALPATPVAAGETLAAVAFCASFVGMSSADRLDGWVRVALAGALCGLVFVAVTAAFPGSGGKLGTVAFVSCVTTAGGERLLDRVGGGRRVAEQLPQKR